MYFFVGYKSQGFYLRSRLRKATFAKVGANQPRENAARSTRRRGTLIVFPRLRLRPRNSSSKMASIELLAVTSLARELSILRDCGVQSD